MIDFHTHLLPQIDDGSQNVEESIQMLELERRQGVHTVVATPHFYADRGSIQGFLYDRAESFEILIAQAGELEMPKILMGAEAFYFDGIGDAGQIRRLCIQDTDVLLLEMPFRQWDRKMVDNVKKLLERQQMRVMLAHIDRYFQFQKDTGYLEGLLEMPVLVQANADAFLKMGRRKKLMNLMADGKVHVLGSDCHNMSRRPPNLLQARAWIERKLGKQPLERIDAVGRHILQVENDLG